MMYAREWGAPCMYVCEGCCGWRARQRWCGARRTWLASLSSLEWRVETQQADSAAGRARAEGCARAATAHGPLLAFFTC